MNGTISIGYLGQAKRTKHILIEGISSNKCQICLEEKRTNSHHVIPKRANCKSYQLRNLRVLACTECHEKIHIENGELKKDPILVNQAKLINKLKILLSRRRKEEYAWLIKLIDNSISNHQNIIPEIIVSEPRQARHAKMKYQEGAVKTLRMIRRQIQIKSNQSK